VTPGRKPENASTGDDDGKKPGEKPIRLVDLIPRKDVKGGARTLFGASAIPPKPPLKKPPKRP
jgi:hypothetical protein